jgi:hypothetical protein
VWPTPPLLFFVILFFCFLFDVDWSFINEEAFLWGLDGRDHWLRLAMAWLGLDGICKIPKKLFFKINLNILTFYITSITFYHFSNKKITTKQKISLFYTKHSYFFSHINQICYSINQFLPIQSPESA